MSVVRLRVRAMCWHRGNPGRHRSGRRAASHCGFSLLEVLFVTGCVGVLTAMAVPQVLSTLDRSRGSAAARYLAGRMAVARGQAVNRSRNVALRFERSQQGYAVALFADGNGNGVREADIAAAADVQIEPAVDLSDLFAGVAIALTEGSPATEAVQIGNTALMSFSPEGTATSGTVYVRGADGTQWAVRVLGATARARVLQWSPGRGEWIEAS